MLSFRIERSATARRAAVSAFVAAAVRRFAFGVGSAWLVSACCFGAFLPPSPEEPGPREAAQAYWDAHAPALAARDAGPGRCFSGFGSLATDLAVVVLSRGHAGGDLAGEVQLDIGSCIERAVVLVVLVGGVWQGVQLVAYDGAGVEVARVGADPGYRLEFDFRDDDVDLDVDELF